MKKKQHTPTLRELYPHYNEEQLKTAEANVDRYLKVVLRIYERIRLDPVAYPALRAELSTLTEQQKRGEMNSERSNIEN